MKRCDPLLADLLIALIAILLIVGAFVWGMSEGNRPLPELYNARRGEVRR